MDITIGIINYNTKKLLDECLGSVACQNPGLSKNTIVVDNASDDGSQSMVKSKYPDIRLIESEENLGYSKAVNKVLRIAKTNLILILNSDIILHEKSIETMVKFMNQHPQIGALGPLLLNPDGSYYSSGRNFPSLLDGSMHAFLGVIAPNNRFSRRYKMLDWDRKSGKEVDWISGAAMCLRKSAVEEIDYFDEGYFMYVEDVDLCYRLWENGWKVFILPESRVTHLKGKSSEQDNVNMLKEHQRSIYRFFKKQNAHSWKKILAPVVKLGLFIRIKYLIAISARKGG